MVNPASPHPSSQPSPAPPLQPLGPLDNLRKHNIVKVFSEFHIKRDATHLAPPSVDIKDIYKQFFTPILDPSLNLEETIGAYFRACPPHQNDQKIAYILLCNNRIRLTNVDPLLQAGYPNLYQHIHLHQQATDAINFMITSSLLLGANDKFEDKFKEEFPHQQLYLVAILVKTDEPWTRNILHPYRRESSQHQECELNQPTSVQLLHINETGHILSIVEGPTGKYIFKKVHSPQISSTHLFDQSSISGPLNSNAHSLMNLVNHKTIWSKAHRHINVYIPHMMHIVKRQEQAASTSKRTMMGTSGLSTSTLPTSSTQREPPSPSSTATTWMSTDNKGYIKTSMSQSATSLTSMGPSTSSLTSEGKVRHR